MNRMIRASISFKIKILGALSVGDDRSFSRRQPQKGLSLLPSQNHYLKRYTIKWIILSLFLFGCNTSQPPKAPDEVTLQLKWVHQAQFAGFYVAQEKGYYTEENIKITFLEGGPEIDLAQNILFGRAHFGVMAPEDILIQRSQGKPIKALAAIYRRSAVVFVALADSGIFRPSDFIGKTVASGNVGGAARDFELQLYALMKRLNLDISGINMTSYDPKYIAFSKGQIDVTPAFSTGGVIKLRQKGLNLNLIWPSDYGIHFFSDTLVTTDSLIEKYPDLVTRFLRATLKGWQDAVEDYPKAVDITMKYARIADPLLQKAMMEAMLPLVHTGEDAIGWMKPEIWQGMANLMSIHGLLSSPIDVNQAYTLRFLEEIHKGQIQ
ncbi:MAG: ABC transporter substrate-binding protein [Desulfatirhabdiaceae bacterium]